MWVSEGKCGCPRVSKGIRGLVRVSEGKCGSPRVSKGLRCLVWVSKV